MKDSSKVALLTKFYKSTDVLSWMDGFEKYLRKVTGIDHFPLAYLFREDAVVPVTTEDLLHGKCYSKTHGSLYEELVFCKSHLVHVLKLTKLLSMI